MLKGIDLNNRIKFTFTSDREEPKTTLTVRPLSSFEMMGMASLKDKNDLLSFVSMSVVEVENAGMDKDVFLQSLRVQDLSELVMFLLGVNNLNEEDKKKF